LGVLSVLSDLGVKDLSVLKVEGGWVGRSWDAVLDFMLWARILRVFLSLIDSCGCLGRVYVI
jgi:hypothetical protein